MRQEYLQGSTSHQWQGDFLLLSGEKKRSWRYAWWVVSCDIQVQDCDTWYALERCVWNIKGKCLSKREKRTLQQLQVVEKRFQREGSGARCCVLLSGAHEQNFRDQLTKVSGRFEGRYCFLGQESDVFHKNLNKESAVSRCSLFQSFKRSSMTKRRCPCSKALGLDQGSSHQPRKCPDAGDSNDIVAVFLGSRSVTDTATAS